MIHYDAFLTDEEQEVVPAPPKVDQIFSITPLVDRVRGFAPIPIVDSEIITHFSMTPHRIGLSKQLDDRFPGVRWMPKLDPKG
jgi:hypothetical protein